MSSKLSRGAAVSSEQLSWTKAESTGGYTMRYIPAMRNYLIECWGPIDSVEKSLVLLLNHLSTKGFGEGGNGVLREFLLQAVRAAVSTQHRREPAEVSPPLDLIQQADPEWLRNWSECLLDRAWRGLERKQHSSGQPVYWVVRLSNDHADESAESLSKQVIDTDGNVISVERFSLLLIEGRKILANLITKEVRDTLVSSDNSDLINELRTIGLDHLVEPYAAG